jgi:hypothetical protein
MKENYNVHPTIPCSNSSTHHHNIIQNRSIIKMNEMIQIITREDLTEQEKVELEQAMQQIENIKSDHPFVIKAKELVANTRAQQRKYQSKRLKSMEETWSDVEFLVYIRDRVDFRTKHQDLKEASDKRISAIISKLLKYEQQQSIQ